METDLLWRRVDAWLDADPDTLTRTELAGIRARGAADEAAALFAGRLEFGTAGLRGTLGPGPLRMNRLVVRQTTAGLADYLERTVPDAKSRGVVVAHDARRMSPEFAAETVGVLAARGFRVFAFDGITATPVCAWAVLDRGAAAGIMVTASHNPPEYNGYKVYWGNGAQIIPPHDEGIARAIALVEKSGAIELADARAVAVHKTTLTTHDETRYLDAVVARRISASRQESSLRVAYSAMHGVGAHLALPLLRRAGYAAVASVASQEAPDGEFPTVRFPNPEEPGAIDLLLDLAASSGAQVAVANDPDADRVAVAVPARDEGWLTLTGDQVGALLGSHVLSHGTVPCTVATTIVSSRLLSRIAAAHGAEFVETLTGFKWIANAAIDRERDGIPFAFGYEEAIGYTVGPLVRDKDGIGSLLAIVDMADALARQGRTLLDELDALYRVHGVFATRQVSLKVNAAAESPGARLRRSPPTEIGGSAVERHIDLLAGIETGTPPGSKRLTLPSSDVLMWYTADDSRIIVRPSGTEPKVKCYYEVVEPVGHAESVGAAQARATKRLDQLVAAHQKSLAS
jgi:phosphomannomutase